MSSAPVEPPVAAAIPMPRSDRVLRLTGALLALTGLTVTWVLRIAAWDRHIYVSGFGAEGEPRAQLFNLALAGIGVGGALIGIATLRARRPPGPATAVAALLIGGGACFVLSSRITCSAGCPVPFTEGAEARDLAHVALAVLGFGLAALAMLLSARLGARSARLVRPAVIALAVPASAGALLALLGTNSPLGGWLELMATTAGILWLIVFALASPGTPRRSQSRGEEPVELHHIGDPV